MQKPQFSGRMSCPWPTSELGWLGVRWESGEEVGRAGPGQESILCISLGVQFTLQWWKVSWVLYETIYRLLVRVFFFASQTVGPFLWPPPGRERKGAMDMVLPCSFHPEYREFYSQVAKVTMHILTHRYLSHRALFTFSAMREKGKVFHLWTGPLRTSFFSFDPGGWTRPSSLPAFCSLSTYLWTGRESQAKVSLFPRPWSPLRGQNRTQ